MNSDDPIAFFITWTIYGTHLQGDELGWTRRRKGYQSPQPALVRWRSEKLKYPVERLDAEQRDAVETECRRLCQIRNWQPWELNARSTHCHTVVTAKNYSGKIVRDQLKANCTRVLRESWPKFLDRQVWTVGGDCQCINNEDDLDTVCAYVRDAQDRKERDE